MVYQWNRTAVGRVPHHLAAVMVVLPFNSCNSRQGEIGVTVPLGWEDAAGGVVLPIL
jgi:hypothetical protein